MSNFSAFSWFLRYDAPEILEAMEDEKREEFTICLDALLAMAED